MPHAGAFAGLIATNRRRLAPFTPSGITDVLDWVDCNDTAKITAASNLVSAVAGQLGVVTWSQATGAQQPKSGVSTVNGRNVIDNGTAAGAGKDTWLQSGTISLATTGCHQWWVAQVTAFDSGAGLTMFMDGDATHRAACYADNDASKSLSIYAGGTYPNRSAKAGDTSLHLFISNLVGGGTSVLYVDGTAYNLPSNIGSTTFVSSRIGQDATHSAGGANENRMSGHYCAWGLGSSIMGSTDLANLLGWAQSIWGTP